MRAGQDGDDEVRRGHTVHVSGLHPNVPVEAIKRFFEESCGGVVKTRLATMGARVLCWLEFATAVATLAALEKNDKAVPVLSPHRLKVVRSRNAIQAKIDGTFNVQPSESVAAQSVSTELQYPQRKSKTVELLGASLFEPDTSYSEVGCRTNSSYVDRGERRRAEGSTSPRQHARNSSHRRSPAPRSVSPPPMRQDFAHNGRAPAANRNARELSPPAEQYREPWSGSLPRCVTPVLPVRVPTLELCASAQLHLLDSRLRDDPLFGAHSEGRGDMCNIPLFCASI